MRKAVILYGLFVGLVFAPFFLLGKVFVPGDFLSFIYPWKAYSDVTCHNMEIFDVAVLFYPQDVFLNKSLKAGVLPLWNPQIFSGHPAIASGQSGFLYPPRLLFHLIFETAVAKTLIQLVHIFGMGLAMYWFFRLKGFNTQPSMLGGLVWMGNACVSSLMEYEHMPIAGMYLGLLLAVFEKAVGGGQRWWLALPVLGALSLHSGHLQLSLYTGGIFIVYALVRLASLRRLDVWWKFLGVGVLTVGISAPTVAPFLDLLSNSQRAPLNLEANSASLGSILMTLFSPDIWGNPTTGFLLNRCQANLVFVEFTCFVGIIPLILAVTARGREALTLQVISVVSLLLASYTIPLALPLLIPGRLLIVLVFCLCYLSVIGAQQLQAEPLNRNRARRAGGIVLVFWLAVLGYIFYLLQNPALVLEWWQANPQWVKLPPMGVGEEEFVKAFRGNYSWNPQLLLPLVGAGALMFRPDKVRLLIGVTLVELVLFSSGFNTSVSRDSLFPTTPEIESMQTSENRVVSINCANFNTLTPYNLSLANGYESVVDRRYGMAVSQVEPGRTLPMRSLSFQRLDLPMVDALSVEYALFPPFMETEAPGWELVLKGKGGNVYQNREVLPRFHLLGKVAPLHSLAQLQTFEPSSEAFVSVAPPPSLQAGNGTIKLEGETANSLDLLVETETSQLLVVTDAYHSGWKCKVNDRKVEVFPVNIAQRGVYLPAGVHRVRFYFAPDLYVWGMRVMMVCLFVLLGIFLASFKRTNAAP